MGSSKEDDGMGIVIYMMERWVIGWLSGFDQGLLHNKAAIKLNRVSTSLVANFCEFLIYRVSFAQFGGHLLSWACVPMRIGLWRGASRDTHPKL